MTDLVNNRKLVNVALPMLPPHARGAFKQKVQQ